VGREHSAELHTEAEELRVTRILVLRHDWEYEAIRRKTSLLDRRVGMDWTSLMQRTKDEGLHSRAMLTCAFEVMKRACRGTQLRRDHRRARGKLRGRCMNVLK
jgi:hypothetical protein